ncbi:MAG TPA: serine/threonine protein kinase, partial [Cyanobacteria bacterium UBA11166]|nr:serine/threonine protein kinase [Cyanobacteria bacterium UBA11166]
EMARISGKFQEAMILYDDAIASAKEHEFIQNEALGNELAAKFWLAQGKEDFAKLYMRKARQCYQIWGAKRKVEDLEEKYPQWFTSPSSESDNVTTTSITTTSGKSGKSLDIETVIKASETLSQEIVLKNLLANLMKIAIANAGAQKGYLILKKEENWFIEAEGNVNEEEAKLLQSIPLNSPNLLSPTIANYVIHSQETVLLNDAVNEGQYIRDPYIVANQPKSILCIPLINQGKLSAILYLENNLTTNAFTSQRVELLQTLSAQAAISIENSRLYQELAEYNRTLEDKVAERTQELQEKNEELSTTIHKLKTTQNQIIAQEKLASLGALTAGIAHEIKNPLNFVNNFAQLSVELTQELQDEINNQQENLDSETIEYIGEILTDLKGNVEKINHHGKRADNIVHGMMMHAQGSSGKREPTNINNLLAEFVNLAYHGMRAKDANFNITIEGNYDESVGELNVVPQDMSRVFLNLTNNACYAAYNKRKQLQAEAGDGGTNFQPIIWVSTKNLEDKVEIHIRDNGTGMPPDVVEKIFNPFFTTKPTGEGTGLGLSITYDIIVQGHQGEIKVETEVGSYAEFIVILPKERSEFGVRSSEFRV